MTPATAASRATSPRPRIDDHAAAHGVLPAIALCEFTCAPHPAAAGDLNGPRDGPGRGASYHFPVAPQAGATQLVA